MTTRNRSYLVLASLLLIIIATILLIRPHLHEIDNFLVSIGWAGPIVVVLLYTLLSLTPIPTDPLTVMLGILYGPIWGMIISWAGNTCAALAEYFVAHHLGNVTKFIKHRKHLPWGLDKAPIDSLGFLLLGRLAPGIGGKLVSVLAGLYQVPIWKYLWTTSVMNLVGSVGYIVLGHISSRWF